MEDNTINIFIAIIGIIFVVIVVFFFIRKKSNVIESNEQESLSMKEVISFFKQDECKNSLKANNNLLAVVVREKQNNDKLAITLTLYDKEKEKIADFPHAKRYIVKNIDSDLKDNFGNKDMIILE